MPRDSQGNFTNPFDWRQDAANGIDIVPDRHQEGDDDQAQGLTDSLDRKGRGGMQADLQMGNNKIVQVNEGTAATDAVTVGQAQKREFAVSSTETGTANAYAISLTPSPTAYTAGLVVTWTATNANTGASTLQINALTPAPAIQWNGAVLVGGEIPAGARMVTEFDGTAWQIVNVPQILQSAQGGTGTTTPLGTAAFVNTGTAIGNVSLLEDVGAGTSGLPAVDGRQLTGTINQQPTENAVNPATDLIAFYDSSASADRSTIIQTILDLVPSINQRQLAKAWVVFTGATAGVRQSENISGVVRNGPGDYTISFTTPFASANFVIVGSCGNGDENPLAVSVAAVMIRNYTAGNVRILTVVQGSNATDQANVNIACYGPLQGETL